MKWLSKPADALSFRLELFDLIAVVFRSVWKLFLILLHWHLDEFRLLNVKGKVLLVTACLILYVGLPGLLVANRYTEFQLNNPFLAEPITRKDHPAAGQVFTATLMNLMRDEFSRPFGGYRPDNIFYFGWPWNNVKNFQTGVMETVGRTVYVMNDRMARKGGGSDEFDERLAAAAQRLNADRDTLFLSALRVSEAQTLLSDYYRDLQGKKATFQTHPYALREMLRLFQDILGDAHKELSKEAGWWEIDNLYYHSWGASYAVARLMKALEIEYDKTITEKSLGLLFADSDEWTRRAFEHNPPFVIRDGNPNDLFTPNHRSNIETFINSTRFNIVSIIEALNI